MDIFGKSTFNKKEIESKILCGFDKFEMQLKNECLQDDWLSKIDVNYYSQYDIYALHVPLTKKNMYIANLEVLCTMRHDLLKDMFKLAQDIANTKDRPIILVTHSDCTKEFLEQTGIWEKIVQILRYLLNEHPNVIVGIENVTPFRTQSSVLTFANNLFFDNVQMVQELKWRIDEKRIVSVLDTCHAMLVNKYVSEFYKILKPNVNPDLSLTNFMVQNKSVCGLIHLAGYKGNGYDKGHGTPLEEGSPQLKEFIKAYKDLGYNCPITLEVREDDYYNPKNYQAEKHALLKGWMN